MDPVLEDGVEAEVVASLSVVVLDIVVVLDVVVIGAELVFPNSKPARLERSDISFLSDELLGSLLSN